MRNIFKTCTLVMTFALAQMSFAGDFDVPKQPVKYNYVVIPSRDGDSIKNLPARISIPQHVKQPPVVIIAHGSGGVDERGELYRKVLNEQGIATVEIDMWSARGLQGGLSRPQHVKETVPDVFLTIKYIKTLSNVDHNRIGLLGFSWGGVMSMLLSDQQYQAPPELKAMVANYPVCWAYNKVPGYVFHHLRPNTHTLIISGEKDLYDKPDDCQKLVQSLSSENQKQVTLFTFKNATHGFDNRQKNSTFFDPYAFQGKGGNVPIQYNKHATKQAIKTITQFFQTNL